MKAAVRANARAAPIALPARWRPPSTGRVFWLLLLHGRLWLAARFGARILRIRFNYWFSSAAGYRHALRDADRTVREWQQARGLNDL